jgi:UDP-N-acetylglucosamine 4,6-dehydratase
MLKGNYFINIWSKNANFTDQIICFFLFIMINLNNKTIFISGGTGSFGKKYVEYLLINYPEIKEIIIFSRDEYKQHQFKLDIPKDKISKVKFILGDIRDLNRLLNSLKGVDYVIHAAALKQVAAGEENPSEFIKTNIIGSENIIYASIANKVKKVIAMSTDKAVCPISLYGATKLCAERLFISANENINNMETIFSVVRYGNLLGSRGSVLPLFFLKAKGGLIPVTDEGMTRFHINYSDIIKLLMFTLSNTLGGEIVIPKLPSFKIIDLARAVDENCKIEFIGVRQGEKLHEQLIDSDTSNIIELDKYFMLLPKDRKRENLNYLKEYNPIKLNKPFVYSSENNNQWLNVEDLKKIIQFEINN